MAKGPPARQKVRRISEAAKRPHLYLFCEGIATEDIYFKMWNQNHREKALLTIDDIHGDPMTLVKAAIDYKRRQTRESRHARGDIPDQIWCVFDEDEHPHIPEALKLAAENDISIAYSNPCIEIWFLLHFSDQKGFIDRRAVQKVVYNHLSCGKRLTPPGFAKMITTIDTAKMRAQQLDKKHLEDGSPVGSNPSSGVWRLVDEIRGQPGSSVVVSTST